MKTMRLRTVWIAPIAGALIGVTTGCTGIEGEWRLTQVTPTAAQRDIQYRTLNMEKNGTFYAEANENGPVRTVSGTYDFDADADTLSLQEHDGEQNTYDAEIESGGRELHLTRFWEGRKVYAVFERDR